MSEPFLGEIKMFAGNFAPRGYAFCSGQLIPIAQNTALFSLLGTQYGGNGQTTFALPDLQNRTPMFWGQGPGLTPRSIGESSGSSNVTLITQQITQHIHQQSASGTVSGDQTSPANNAFGILGRGRPQVYSTTAPNVQMLPTAIAGGGQPHNNRQPYLGITFIIATQGIFPARN